MLTAHRVADVAGVLRVPVPSPTLPPATTTNCWLLGDTEVFAVDPAGIRPATRASLHATIANRGVAGIVLTHHHADHIGGACDLRSRTRAPIYAHSETAARVPFKVDHILEHGDVIKTDCGPWTVHHTPGHAPGHICLLTEDKKTIVAGDMVAGEGTILLDPPEGNLHQYLASLAQLRSLKPERLLPAHGPSIESGVDYLDHYIEHRNARTQQILKALPFDGAASPIELVSHIYPELPTSFHKIAARQVLCHLLALVTDGRVRRLSARRFQRAMEPA